MTSTTTATTTTGAGARTGHPDDIRFTVGSVRIGRTGAFWSLEREEWKAVLRSTIAEFKADEVTNLAAVVTLRILLSIVPSIIAAVAIAAQVIDPQDITEMVRSAGSLIPGSAREFVDSSLQTAVDKLREDGQVAIIISIGAGVFAASGAAVALVAALNKAYDVPEGRSFVGKRVASLGVLAALLVALIGLFVAIVLGPTLLEALLPERILASGPLVALITVGRYLAAIVVLMLFFSFTFWFGPHRDRPPLRFLSPGAVSGVVLWLLLSYMFGLYVSVSGSYSATYGTFAGVIVMIVWLQYSFTVLLLAAELDHELEVHLRRRAGDPAGDAEGDTADRGTADDMATPAARTQPVDVDAVTEDMPRHPGLIAAAGPGQVACAAGESRSTEAEESRPPMPVLSGAALRTPGGLIAMGLLRRLRR